MLKNIAKKIFIGNRVLQKFYFKTYELALAGMQFGYGKDVKTSGEISALKYIKQKLNNPNKIIVFDVGANKGEYSLQCVEIFGNMIELFAFEPSKKAYEELLQLSETKKEIKTFNLGLHKTKGELTLFTTSFGSKVASIYDQGTIVPEKKFVHSEKITVDTVDNFCLSNGINRIDVLKLDTEGNEYDILLGAKEMIKNNKIKFIQFELGHCNIASRTYFYDFHKLLADNYNLYRILRNGLFRIENYSPKYEIFLNVNYLAELKIG
ncbi:MAG: FkbM family methyltransferase [Ignavibacteria bacterium]